MQFCSVGIGFGKLWHALVMIFVKYEVDYFVGFDVFIILILVL